MAAAAVSSVSTRREQWPLAIELLGESSPSSSFAVLLAPIRIARSHQRALQSPCSTRNGTEAAVAENVMPSHVITYSNSTHRSFKHSAERHLRRWEPRSSGDRSDSTLCSCSSAPFRPQHLPPIAIPIASPSLCLVLRAVSLPEPVCSSQPLIAGLGPPHRPLVAHVHQR